MICPICYDDVFKEDLFEHLVNYHKMGLNIALKLSSAYTKIESEKMKDKK